MLQLLGDVPFISGRRQSISNSCPSQPVLSPFLEHRSQLTRQSSMQTTSGHAFLEIQSRDSMRYLVLFARGQLAKPKAPARPNCQDVTRSAAVIARQVRTTPRVPNAGRVAGAILNSDGTKTLIARTRVGVLCLLQPGSRLGCRL